MSEKDYFSYIDIQIKLYPESLWKKDNSICQPGKKTLKERKLFNKIERKDFLYAC